MNYALTFAIATAATLQAFSNNDHSKQLSDGVIRGDYYVQFIDGGRFWICGTMADGAIDATLDAIANGANITVVDEL